MCELKLRAKSVSEVFSNGGRAAERRWGGTERGETLSMQVEPGAPEGRGGMELHLKKFWHRASIISTAALFSSSSSIPSSPPISPSLHPWLQSAIYAKNWSFSVLALSPPWRHVVLFGTYLQFLSLRKKSNIKKHGPLLFVPPLLCVFVLWYTLVFCILPFSHSGFFLGFSPKLLFIFS